MRHALRTFLAVTASCAMAQGDAEPLHTIANEGTATVSAEPTHADFWFTSSATGENLRAAAETALAFEEKLKKSFESNELEPASTTVSGLGIPDLHVNKALVSARVRFSLSLYSDAEKRSLSFASLCDTIRKVGESLRCSTEGPFLGIDDPEAVEQEAVARATENAFHRADTAANLMNSQIFDVQEVVVLSVEWNPPGDPLPAQPDVMRLTCAARVKVVYRYAPY